MTHLQDCYDSFFLKTEDDFTGKEIQVFGYFKAALSKCYKTVRHSLEYTVDENYDGEFVEILDQDEIELIALHMKKEYLRKIIAKLENAKTRIGTKDFNRLPDKVTEYNVMSKAKKDLDDEIKAFEQDFNTY
jgi:hypothetical protein